MENLSKVIAELKSITAIGIKDTLTIHEAAIFTGMTENAIRHRLNEIRHYKPGKMVYIDKADLVKWMHQNPVNSKSDISRQAAIYCANNN